MTKKSEIIKKLKQGDSFEEIVESTGSSQSYIYRLQREINESEGEIGESEGDSTYTSETESDSTDDLVIDSASGVGSTLEGDHGNMEKKENKDSTNKVESVGGVKKRTKNRSKRTKNSSKMNEKEQISEQNEQISEPKGVIKWMKKNMKMMLMILTSSILLIVAMLSLSMKSKPKEVIQKPRFPMIS